MGARTDRRVVNITASSYISDFDRKLSIYEVIWGAESLCATFSSIGTMVLELWPRAISRDHFAALSSDANSYTISSFSC